MTAAQWKKLVLSHMRSDRFNDFGKEIARRDGQLESVEEYNEWLGLATNIWNNTRQPGRGGKSANELVREHYGQRPDD